MRHERVAFRSANNLSCRRASFRGAKGDYAFSADAVQPDPGAERFGNKDCAVGLLEIFQDGDNGPRAGHGRAVERVDELRALAVALPAADAQPPRLVIGAVRGGGDFAILAFLAAARHPGLEVELAVGGPA